MVDKKRKLITKSKDNAGKARRGVAKRNSAAAARVQRRENPIGKKVASLARKGGKIPLDGVNKQPL